MTSENFNVIPNVRLRPVSGDDCDLLFHWRNLPEIVNLSSSRAEVSRSEHERWFKNALQNPNFHFFIILENEIPIGQVLFESKQKTEAEKSIYLLTEKCGRGIGVAVIQAACRLMFIKTPISKIIANIRLENFNSISAFKKSGFSEKRQSISKANHLTMEISN
jgi:RimJ/RimL family protein N-acetyltransferase